MTRIGGYDPFTRSRRGDPETSHKAAKKVSYKMTELRRTVLLHFLRRPTMTDLDLQDLCDDQGSTYRTRRSELTEMGLIQDSGRRTVQVGSPRILWAITESGLARARLLKNE